MSLLMLWACSLEKAGTHARNAQAGQGLGMTGGKEST